MKIQLFVRHCHFSEVSGHKGRMPGFSRAKCYENLLQTADISRVDITFLLDSYHPVPQPHFLFEQTQFPIIEIKEGTESGSFLKLLDYVTSLNLDDETIVYFLEDDYLHRHGWVDILLEGFTVPNVSYVTLFDHRDKYYLPMYEDLHSKIFHTKSCHWRSTPSTTNTYAMKFKTLKRDLEIHKKYSRHRKITNDHKKFLNLKENGSLLISPIPGWSTHVDEGNISPCVDWESAFC